APDERAPGPALAAAPDHGRRDGPLAVYRRAAGRPALVAGDLAARGVQRAGARLRDLQGRRDGPRPPGARPGSVALLHRRPLAAADRAGRAAAGDRSRAAVLPGLELGDRLRAPGRQRLVDDALRRAPHALPRPLAGRGVPRPRRARLTLTS